MKTDIFDDDKIKLIEKLGITPGEWTLPHHANGNINCDCPFIFARNDGEYRTIATVNYNNGKKYADQYFDKETSKANARLIAAAPEMLIDWITTALRIEKYNHSGATKNQLLDFIYIDAVKNACKATNKTWEEIKELLN